MNKSKLLYFYSDENNLENQENFDLETIDLCIINSKDTIVNYSSVYNKIKSLNIDAIIIDKSSFVLDKEIFEFATYIRLMKNNIWDVPIYIYCNFGYKGIIEFLKSDKTNISKTNRFEIINNSLFEKDALEIGKIKFFQNLEQKKQESLNWNDFIKTINVEKPETSNHTISNEWAIYRWAHAIGANDSDIEKIENKVENNIYFKYLQAIYPIKEIQEIREEQLKVENLQDSKILYIDDEADKGWNGVLWELLKQSDVEDFELLGDELKSLSQDEIINESKKKIEEQKSDIVILDFRLHDSDFDCEIKEVTGYKLLQVIKKINPGIQVIIFSATNKVWNLQALQEAGADGFIIKESPENSIDPNFTKEVIISFINELDKANKRRFLKEVFTSLEKISKNIKDTDCIEETKFDSFLKLIKRQTEVIKSSTKKIDLKDKSTLDIVYLNCFSFLEHFKNEYYLNYSQKEYRYSLGQLEDNLNRYSYNKHNFNIELKNEFIRNGQSDSPSFFCTLTGIIVDYFELCDFEDNLIVKLAKITQKRNDFIHSQKEHFDQNELNKIIEIMENITKEMKE